MKARVQYHKITSTRTTKLPIKQCQRRPTFSVRKSQIKLNIWGRGNGPIRHAGRFRPPSNTIVTTGGQLAGINRRCTTAMFEIGDICKTPPDISQGFQCCYIIIIIIIIMFFIDSA